MTPPVDPPYTELQATVYADTLMDMRKAVTYSRVSTGRQAESGLSLDHQERVTAEHVERKGWDLVAHVSDEGRSGRKSENRDGLQAALAMLAAGEADVLVVAKLDRLARSVIDFAKIMATADAQGWDLVLLDLEVDTTSAAGRLMVRIFAACAEFESDRIGDRVRDAHAERQSRGVRHGKPLLAEDVRERIATARAGGSTLAAIAADLNLENVPTARGGRWHPSTVAHVCRSVALDEAQAAA